MSKKIIVIGTLHAGITPNNELKEVLESFKPDQLLVEISNEDILKDELNFYPPEMIFALKWAKKNNVDVVGFDSKINIFRKGVLPQDNLAMIEKQKKIINKLSWEDFNKLENEKKLNIDGLDKLIDLKKEKIRENEILKNIETNIAENGTIIIITGTRHLEFFEQNIKNAIFPFRNSHNNIVK